MDTLVKIQEVIVVEGKDDIAAVKRAVQAEVIVTFGYVLSKATLNQIKQAKERCGVIVFTDPDTVGEKLRKRIDTAVPGCKHAFLPKESALRNGDIGIENASPESIREALIKVRTIVERTEPVFTQSDLQKHGLVGTEGAAEKRAFVGKVLGIGDTNSKQFLNRLNHYAVSTEEFLEACRLADERHNI